VRGGEKVAEKERVEVEGVKHQDSQELSLSAGLKIPNKNIQKN
jgi:hypothetical protein